MSKSAILERIRENKPAQVALPDLSEFHHYIPVGELIRDFIKTSIGNMSTVVNITGSKVSTKLFLKKFIAENYPPEAIICNATRYNETSGGLNFKENAVELFIAESPLGVAENGCLWFDDSILSQRISAFACQHTLLLINHKNIVPTMHQAYQRIKINKNGYGVFIAGPSKTADIEQSLVVGAQGAISNTVILI